MKALAAGLTALALTAACHKSLPPRFGAEQSAAQAAYARGEYLRAAEHWARAAEAAPDARERDEAVYRRAASLERAGRLREADELYAAIERGSGERAARAAFARAELELQHGDPAAGLALLRAAFQRFPGSGLARHAAQRWLAAALAERGLEAARADAAALLTRLRGSELEETLLFALAKLTERQGDAARALALYLEGARRFPYPRGAYWDDALLGAARIEERLGRFDAAIRHLERLLAERETARLSGSYERAHYAEARFHIAELYRDRLADPARAQQEFRRVWSDHPTALLADDALFEAALLARKTRDAAGACRNAELLLRKKPDSRYAGCANELCPRLPRIRECRPYVLRRITGQTAEEGTHSSSSSR